MQSGARKDIEHAFHVLQAPWKIVKNPCRQWDLDTINDIMLYRIILYTMRIQDGQGKNLEPVFEKGLKDRGGHA